MVSTLNLVLGGLAVVLGVAWIVRPMVMIRWQNRLLYFWMSGEPQVGQVSSLVGRIGGLVLALVGVALLAGVQL